MRREKPEASSQKPEGRRQRRAGRRAFAFFTGFWLLAAGFFSAGCGDSQRQSSEQRSEKALRDPFNYSPQFEKTDETGGGLLEYDRDGMRKDLRNVFDP